MRRLATIDVGTNSVRSIIVEVADDGRYKVIDDEKAYTRLGQGRGENGRLAAEPMERTLEALRRMLGIARSMDVSETRAIATAAMRDAPNGPEFVARIAEELGLAVEVISGEHEARLAFLSARANVALGAVAAVIDLGGGSLEVVRAAAGEIEEITSLPLGAVVLAERFVRTDPISAKEFKRLSEHVRESLLEALSPEAEPVATVVGSGGTVNALAAMTAARSRRTYRSLQGFEITLADVVHLLARLKRSTAAERTRVPGLPESRVDIIIPGAIVIAETMKALGANRLVLNAKGIREGVVLEMLGKRGALPPVVRTDSATAFAQRFHYDPEHAEQVSRLAQVLLEELGSELGLSPEHAELLQAAAIMHDVGYYVSYERHHRQSHHLISYSQLPGFTAREIGIVAAIARYHTGSLPKPSHDALASLQKRDRTTAIALAALLRVADGMDRARSGQVSSVRVEREEDRVLLVLSGDPEASSDLTVDAYGAQEKSDLLALLLGKEVCVRVETPTSS